MCLIPIALLPIHQWGCEEAERGEVWSGVWGETIPGLLFADDTCLMASDAAGLKKSLDVLVEWCKE